MLKIRMARAGTKKRPFYHIVVADSRMPRDGRYIERLGTYNPKLPKDAENRVTLKDERIKHWLGEGAQTSDRVAYFLGKAGVAPMPERKHNPEKMKPKAKAVERAKAKAEKAQAAAEAAKAPADTPVEEAAVPEDAAAEG